MKNYSLLCMIFVIACFSCGEDPVVRELDRNEKKLVDSLYRQEIKLLKPQLDSICEAKKKAKYQTIKDSMITLRLEEIDNLLPKQ